MCTSLCHHLLFSGSFGRHCVYFSSSSFVLQIDTMCTTSHHRVLLPVLTVCTSWSIRFAFLRKQYVLLIASLFIDVVD
jgi:hypothetical protein